MFPNAKRGRCRHRPRLRFRPGSCDPGRFPFAVRSPEGAGLRRTLEKSGIGLRLTLLSQAPNPSLPWPASRRTLPASAVAAFPNFVPCGTPLLIAKCQSVARNRFAPADFRESCLWITGISWITRPKNNRPPRRPSSGTLRRPASSDAPSLRGLAGSICDICHIRSRFFAEAPF